MAELAAHERLGITAEEMVARNPATLRKVQLKTPEKWVDTRLKDLKVGDVFRFLSPNESYLNEKRWVAIDKPFINDYYVWTVNAEPVVVPTTLLEEGYR
jgi:hypothetical protein